MVMAGASYGGFQANWIQGHNERMGFKAIVCHDGGSSSLLLPHSTPADPQQFSRLLTSGTRLRSSISLHGSLEGLPGRTPKVTRDGTLRTTSASGRRRSSSFVSIFQPLDLPPVADPLDDRRRTRLPLARGRGNRRFQHVSPRRPALLAIADISLHSLQRLGVPSRFVYFASENHWVLEAHNGVRWHEEVLKWMDEWTSEESVVKA